MAPIAGGTIITLMAATAASSSQEFETFLKLELPAASRIYFTSRKDVVKVEGLEKVASPQLYHSIPPK
jgi:hypothetical protein